MSFIIFSGSIDNFLNSFFTIQHYLKECLKKPDYLPLFFLLLKVLLIRFNNANFSELWNKFFPEVHILIIKAIEKSSKFERILNILRFLEFLVVFGYDDIYKTLFCFAADVPEIQEDSQFTENFTPAIMKRFIHDFKIKVKWNNINYPEVDENKTMKLNQYKIKDYDEIDKIAKSFIQFCICYSTQFPLHDEKSLENDIEKELINFH